MKLSLSMICKGELANLKRLHPIIKNYIDEWVVVVPPGDTAISFLQEVGAKVIIKDFTQPIEPEIIKQFDEYGLEVPEGYRIFNFAAARNESLANSTGDYVLWLDADDEPVGLGRVREFLEGRQHIDVIDAVYDYATDKEGNPISDHVRERIVRNNGNFEWRGAELGLIHETIVAKNFQPRRTEVPKEEFHVRHVPGTGHATQSSTRNHMALLYEYLKTEGKDPRTTYYLGVSFFNFKQYEFSIKVLQEYIRVGGWDEERYRAWIRMAEAYHQLGDKESSRNAYLNAQKELPDYPDSYFGLGESYHSDGQWDKAISYLLTGLQKPIPKTKSAVDMVKYAFRPLPFLALSYMQLGKSDLAFEFFQKAKKLNPNHPWVHEYEQLFVDMKDLDDYIRNFVKVAQLAQKYYPETLPQLAQSIPDKIMDQELLLSFRRKYAAPKTWPDNSVVFFCSQAFEEWGPHSLETGTGGSEEAIIQLSKRLAKMGWDVTVYNNCVEEETVDGVKWVRYERFNPRDDFNILVSWRNNAFIEPKKFKKGFIDVHDVPDNRYYVEEYARGITLLAKSDFHRSLFKLPEGQFEIVSNGIDLAQFAGSVSAKKKNSLVWTSSYDRGLEYLLEMWPTIREAVPDTTLDIYYGWNLFDVSAYGKSAEGKRWKARMLDLFNQEGVVEHGRVNSEDIAEAYLQADVWAYPTDFPEIDCITATKAMAAKCVPITTDFAVMKERNQGIIVEGDIKETATKEKFAQELITLLKDKKRKEEIRSKLDVAKYDWDTIAGRWDELFRAEPDDDYPLVSIIIPTYNRPEYLKEAVQSAIEQTYPNKEIIVADDGSDEVPELPAGVKYIRLEHSGKPAVPKNIAIKEAKGEWHYFLDDDDKFWSRHSLMHMMRHKNDGDLIFSNTTLAFPNNEHAVEHWYKDFESSKHYNAIPGVYLLRASFSKKVLNNEEMTVGEDYERTMALLEAGAKPYHVPSPHYWYRHHGEQIQYSKTKAQDFYNSQTKAKYRPKELRRGAVFENKDKPVISLLVPTRNRPEMLQRMYESAMATAAHPECIEVVAYIDNDDASYDDYSPSNLKKVRGDRIVLSQMWNECYKAAGGEYFMHAGDDLIFRTQGWDEQIVYAFPEDKIAFVHGRDGSDQDNTKFGTHGFLHRNWVETVGYFVPPYFSCDWNDTWLNDVANRIDRHIFVDDVLIEHMHPAWRKRDVDETDRERMERGSRDNVRALYDSKAEEREQDARKLLGRIFES